MAVYEEEEQQDTSYKIVNHTLFKTMHLQELYMRYLQPGMGQVSCAWKGAAAQWNRLSQHSASS